MWSVYQMGFLVLPVLAQWIDPVSFSESQFLTYHFKKLCLLVCVACLVDPMNICNLLSLLGIRSCWQDYLESKKKRRGTDMWYSILEMELDHSGLALSFPACLGQPAIPLNSCISPARICMSVVLWGLCETEWHCFLHHLLYGEDLYWKLLLALLISVCPLLSLIICLEYYDSSHMHMYAVSGYYW